MAEHVWKLLKAEDNLWECQRCWRTAEGWVKGQPPVGLADTQADSVPDADCDRDAVRMVMGS